jgi:hypothetical protein
MDQKISGTSRVGYDPEIKQPVKPITIDIGKNTRTGSGSTPSIQLGDFVPPEQVDQISPDDQTIINEFIGLYTDSKQRLDAVGKQLDNYLSTLAIPYDPARFPDLAEAHTHICGRPGATNVITYRDIQNRWALEKEQLKSTISVPRSLDELENMNSSDLQSLSSTKVDKMIQEMLKQVLKQILIWVLEFFDKILNPIRKIKFVKVVPNMIRRAINRLRGIRNQDPMTVATALKDILISEEEAEDVTTSDELSQAGGGYISSVKEVAQSIVEELPPECLIHTGSWNRNVEALVRDTKYAPAYYAKRANMMANDRMESLNKLAAIGIPEGNIATVGGTQIKYANPLPEEYLRARADGSTRISAFGGGLVDSIKQVNGTLVPKLEQVIKNLYEDPSLLCCLIKNLIAMAKMKELKEVLLYIQALLRLYRNLLLLDIGAELAKLGNMIIDLVNSLLQSIFSAYTTLFLNALNKKALKIVDLDKLRQRECEPWNELINMAIGFLTDLLQKIYSYLTGFFTGFNLDIERLSEQSGRAADVAKIDRLLDIIDKVIKFTAAWSACVESKQDPRVILAQRNRLIKTPSGIKVAPVGATRNIGGSATTGGTTTGVGIGIYDASGNVTQTSEANATPGEIGSPLGPDGLQVLLTNYLGVNDSAAKNVITSLNDCSCDKALTANELSEIESFFKG